MMASGCYAAAAATSSTSLAAKSPRAIVLRSSSSSKVSSSQLHSLNLNRGRRSRGALRICKSYLDFRASISSSPSQCLDSYCLGFSCSDGHANRQICCSLGSSLGFENVATRQTSNGIWGRQQQQRLRRPKAQDDDFEIDDDGGFDTIALDDLDEDAEEEFRDYETEYESPTGETRGILQRESDSFINTEGEVEETVVPYKINEDEFHKINLLTCDFFIRKVPDPDDDVYDFREMYVSPPDTDVYSIPKVDADILPNKPVRCTLSNYEVIHTTEPPVDEPRAPLAKTEYEVMKVFLTKHYKDRRAGHEKFILDFEEIYVIDTVTKSFSRANVQVDVPGGKSRDRSLEVLIIRDQGTSFRIILEENESTPDEVIHALHWEKTRAAMETYLRGFRDYEVSNWF
ncbi:unnamed protein product [Calypogeia fissa]